MFRTEGWNAIAYLFEPYNIVVLKLSILKLKALFPQRSILAPAGVSAKDYVSLNVYCEMLYWV